MGLKSLAFLLIVGVIWLAGLFAFAGRVERSTPAREPEAADGIVALTGASDLRISAATHLLEKGKGRRLLVSGVNREATRADIQSVSKAGKRLYDCCVDLGFEAADTIGNGRETAEWARSLHYKRLIVVTSDYHMPRALMELNAAMPDVALTPYPVETEWLDASRWWRSETGLKRMTLEYVKYLAILAREGFIQLGPRDAPAKKEPS